MSNSMMESVHVGAATAGGDGSPRQDADPPRRTIPSSPAARPRDAGVDDWLRREHPSAYMELLCRHIRDLVAVLGEHCRTGLPPDRIRSALSVFDELSLLIAEERQRCLAALPHPPVVTGRLDGMMEPTDARKAI